MHRFFYGGSFSVPQVELTGDEAHHLIRVLRLNTNDSVELFDGCGRAAIAEVAVIQKDQASLRLVSTLPDRPTRRPSLTVLTASPKSERLRWLVEKATELEVDRLVFLKTQHSVVHPGPGKLKKMQATVLAACKQSGRNDLMQIEPPESWGTALRRTAATTDLMFIATPDGRPVDEHITRSDLPARIAVAIGPEGGWSAEEIRTAVDSGASPLKLGRLTLRIETACLAAVSILRSLFATDT
jgi:16S rRNA (uracil1498-N3)-methyltransferase